ncbi:ATP-binding protein [Hymenobacter terrenus]|uniref:ATP-binding protein n=1 Tax=Hymenobacter terrenus TaxID=1629124 RepID=UPI0006962630|nr:ATP-binding protein [Hymenobacter terrenus]
MKWILTVFVLWLMSGPLLAKQRYWDANYDSLARTLPRQRTDSARLRTLVHLLDLRPTNAEALPLLDQLLTLNQQLRLVEDRPYRYLRAGVLLWHQDIDNAAALDTMKAAVTSFDHIGHPIPLLLMDLVNLYNRRNGMEARRRYYEEKLAYYQLRGINENVAACYISQGGYYRRMGDYNRSLDNLLRAADAALSFSRILYVGELLVVGAVYADWGNDAKAVYYLRLAQEKPEFQRVQDLSRVYTYLSLSRLYARQGRYSDALQSADWALATHVSDLYERQMGQAYGLVQKAAVLLQKQLPAQAEPLLRRAQQLEDSVGFPLSGKPGEFELDATWAQYYQAQHDYTRAERHWMLAQQKATTAKLRVLKTKYLKQIAEFYAAEGRPALAQRYSQAYIALTDTINAAQNTFHVAHYESERIEQAQNAQISNLRQDQAVQAERLRLSSWLLAGALLTIVLVSALGVFIYRQLQVNRRTLAQLQKTQQQLVQAEKMAFLGELTAGIAHELQNPLNFMKNFAEVSTSLVDGINSEGPGRAAELEQEILSGLKQNLQQISQHGQRASSIIKDMLEHSRSRTNQRVPSDLNALAEESLTLAYQGLRATDKSFQATLGKEFDPKLGDVAVVTTDMGRVLLNLCTNAFHAVRQRQQAAALGLSDPAYEPIVTVSTHRPTGQRVEIRVRDNGSGMSEAVRTKVFQPFFTTKPAGEGTGLGLSLSYDIVTKGHGGTLTVESREGEGTEFLITLPT